MVVIEGSGKVDLTTWRPRRKAAEAISADIQAVLEDERPQIGFARANGYLPEREELEIIVELPLGATQSQWPAFRCGLEYLIYDALACRDRQEMEEMLESLISIAERLKERIEDIHYPKRASTSLSAD